MRRWPYIFNRVEIVTARENLILDGGENVYGKSNGTHVQLLWLPSPPFGDTIQVSKNHRKRYERRMYY